ncbi:hypothetical protein A986_16561 [Pseudomonas fluorescens BRIP34879]|nr:hypothetical protein A986_16561 [Pseudomonas fluorescens BRIP34879]
MSHCIAINPIATQLARLGIFFDATIGYGKFFIQRALAEAGHIFVTSDNGINDGCLIREYRKRFSGGRMVQEKADQCPNDIVIGQFAALAELAISFGQGFEVISFESNRLEFCKYLMEALLLRFQLPR